jgi:hypothetical protein
MTAFVITPADMDGAGAEVDGAGAEVDGAGAEVEGAGADVDGAGAEVEGAGADVDGAGAEVDGAGADVDGAGVVDFEVDGTAVVECPAAGVVDCRAAGAGDRDDPAETGEIRGAAGKPGCGAGVGAEPDTDPPSWRAPFPADPGTAPCAALTDGSPWTMSTKDEPAPSRARAKTAATAAST